MILTLIVFNDFDLPSLLKIKIIILELQELIVVISLYSCRSLERLLLLKANSEAHHAAVVSDTTVYRVAQIKIPQQ